MMFRRAQDLKEKPPAPKVKRAKQAIQQHAGPKSAQASEEKWKQVAENGDERSSSMLERSSSMLEMKNIVEHLTQRLEQETAARNAIEVKMEDVFKEVRAMAGKQGGEDKRLSSMLTDTNLSAVMEEVFRDGTAPESYGNEKNRALREAVMNATLRVVRRKMLAA